MLQAYMLPANPDDVLYVAKNLRQADRDECYAATGLPPEITLDQIARTHGALAMVGLDGDVFGLCGVHDSAIPGFGIIWMCGTDDISKHRVSLLKGGRDWVENLHQFYERLGNYVDARNTLHMRWLKLLGFKFTAVHILGPQSLPFITFQKDRT